MEFRAWEEALPTKRPFTISTGTTHEARSVIVELRHDGVSGFGEAAPSLRVCGETPAGVHAFLAALGPWIATAEPAEWRARCAELETRAFANPAAKSAVTSALLDLVGKLQNKPAHRLLGWTAAALPTSATVVLDTPAAMAREARAHAGQGFTRLKVKLGEPKHDAARVRAIHDAVPDAILRCDANTAWSEAQSLRLVKVLDKLGVELLEQPVPRGCWRELQRIARAAELPVLADEQVLGLEDARFLAENKIADGFVLKLAKCGGLAQAKAMLDLARSAKLKVMVGCMVESSLGIAASAQVLGRVDWADLDGAWLLAEDPWRGVEIVRGEVRTPTGPGLGAMPRS